VHPSGAGGGTAQCLTSCMLLCCCCCVASEAWGGRSANRGQCAQACRMPYGLIVDGVLRVSHGACWFDLVEAVFIHCIGSSCTDGGMQ
jgi:collagenase-like PrtC family protease